MTRILFSVFAIFTISLTSLSVRAATPVAGNVLDELDPRDPNIENILKRLDAEQEAETGMPSRITEGTDLEIGAGLPDALWAKGNCYRINCRVWAQVNLTKQTLYVYVDGKYTAGYYVSTGIAGRDTPVFDTHPDGRIYDKYTSKQYPEGDYKGLGNMPYAVFISGGFAIHGTTQGNFKKLGTRASHGCIRLHPDAAQYFNKLVRYIGVKSVWITV
ncbi:MAG: L,D-transpeptidase, partial [Bdellovibrionaceae bacterium]|nr:L,D-transpeptidase [Pseudobdellovibrionaceae bacterium]